MTSIVGFVPDLMDRSKLSGVRFVASTAALADAAEEVVVLDLGRPGAADVVAGLVAAGKRVVGFVSHVDRATIDAARTAGAEAYPRSELFRRWTEIATEVRDERPGAESSGSGDPGPRVRGDREPAAREPENTMDRP